MLKAQACISIKGNFVRISHNTFDRGQVFKNVIQKEKVIQQCKFYEK